jgi:hypothetical protein
MKRIASIAMVLAIVAAACAADTGLDAPDGPDDTTSTSAPISDRAPQPATSPTVAPGQESEPTITEPPATEPGDLTPEEGAETAPLPGEPMVADDVDQALVAFAAPAVTDLATRLDIAVSDITIVVAESVVWPDGSLGCPQPDMSYTQVQVDGTRIVLEALGENYQYHSGGARELFLCEKG